jgi:hypothetical protein
MIRHRKGLPMTIDKALIWQTVLAAEDEHGEAAEAYARANAAQAAVEGDEAQAALWEATAEALQTLHTINCHGARLRRERGLRAPRRQ